MSLCWFRLYGTRSTLPVCHATKKKRKTGARSFVSADSFYCFVLSDICLGEILKFAEPVFVFIIKTLKHYFYHKLHDFVCFCFLVNPCGTR